MLVFQADAISSQETVSAGVDLALGLLLVAVGALAATGRLHRRRKAAVPATGGQVDKPEKKDGWEQRVLAEPRLGLACSSARCAGGVQGAGAGFRPKPVRYRYRQDGAGPGGPMPRRMGRGFRRWRPGRRR
jgi:hypothetical protein